MFARTAVQRCRASTCRAWTFDMSSAPPRWRIQRDRLFERAGKPLELAGTAAACRTASRAYSPWVSADVDPRHAPWPRFASAWTTEPTPWWRFGNRPTSDASPPYIAAHSRGWQSLVRRLSLFACSSPGRSVKPCSGIEGSIAEHVMQGSHRAGPPDAATSRDGAVDMSSATIRHVEQPPAVPAASQLTVMAVIEVFHLPGMSLVHDGSRARSGKGTRWIWSQAMSA
jgi:hypothetical protein